MAASEQRWQRTEQTERNGEQELHHVEDKRGRNVDVSIYYLPDFTRRDSAALGARIQFPAQLLMRWATAQCGLDNSSSWYTIIALVLRCRNIEKTAIN